MHIMFWDDISLVKKIYGRALEEVCETYGLTRMELDILLFLANNREYDTATAIVEHRGLSKSHVSMAVKELEAAGLLKRTFSQENRKTAHLELLFKAEEMVLAGRRAQKDFFEMLFRGLSEEERRTAKVIFGKIAGNIRNMQWEKEQL